MIVMLSAWLGADAAVDAAVDAAAATASDVEGTLNVIDISSVSTQSSDTSSYRATELHRSLCTTT